MYEELHTIALDSIKEVFSLATIDTDALLKQYPHLLEKKATFVTLNKQGSLRGCIGSILPNRSLLEDVSGNAISAAFRDNRFEVLRRSELDEIELEVSVLTMPIALPYANTEELKSKIQVGRDGVILQLEGHQATFLPQVWESLPSFESFFASLCQKAGCESACLEKRPNIYTYQVQKIKSN